MAANFASISPASSGLNVVQSIEPIELIEPIESIEFIQLIEPTESIELIAPFAPVHPCDVLLSIVICTRNAARTIMWAIRSVMVQSFKSWELLIMDDGSEDGTGEVLDRLPPDGAYADGAVITIGAKQPA